MYCILVTFSTLIWQYVAYVIICTDMHSIDMKWSLCSETSKTRNTGVKQLKIQHNTVSYSWRLQSPSNHMWQDTTVITFRVQEFLSDIDTSPHDLEIHFFFQTPSSKPCFQSSPPDKPSTRPVQCTFSKLVFLIFPLTHIFQKWYVTNKF